MPKLKIIEIKDSNKKEGRQLLKYMKIIIVFLYQLKVRHMTAFLF